MVWQAYIDESIDDNLVVLAGYIAPAEKWARFAAEWEELLPMGVLGPQCYRFKMSEMAASEDRMKRVPAFYRVIEKLEPIGVAFYLRKSDLKNTIDRICLTHPFHSPVLLDDSCFNEYRIAFFGLMRLFHDFRENEIFRGLLESDQKIDFIFDESSNKKSIIGSWDDFMSRNPNRHRFGATLRFEDDDQFLPLQAADFLAWWVREWKTDKGNTDRSYPWKKNTKTPIYYISATEDDIAESFIEWLRARVPPGITVSDKAAKA